jgi:hypothetical protein
MRPQVVLSLAVLTLAACPARVPAPTPKAAATTALKEKSATDAGTIQQIDSQTQEVTLRRPDGTEFTIVVAPEIDDLQQLEADDRVTLTFREWVALEVKKPDEAKPGVAHTTDVTRAPHGTKPGGSLTDTFVVRAPIAAIDKAASAVTVRDSSGDVAVVKVPDGRTLDEAVVGDVMHIAYTAALAITVAKPEP